MAVHAVFDLQNTTLSGMIRHPEDISGTISELKWPFCGTGFHEIVIKLKDMRVGMDIGADWESDCQDVPVEGDSPILK